MMIHLVVPTTWFSPVPPFSQRLFCCRPLLEDLANNAFQTGGAQKAAPDFLGGDWCQKWYQRPQTPTMVETQPVFHWFPHQSQVFQGLSTVQIAPADIKPGCRSLRQIYFLCVFIAHTFFVEFARGCSARARGAIAGMAGRVANGFGKVLT